mgnify:CR=1 FL=1|jgi:hypothetical protein|tara:strand:- start:1567 stop:1752 length:186 start_codon:yes stop_codon:yes gene_type:complete
MNIILGIIILGLAIFGMAIGVIFNKKPLSGSCGGLNPDGICSLCGDIPENCEDIKLDSSKL